LLQLARGKLTFTALTQEFLSAQKDRVGKSLLELYSAKHMQMELSSLVLMKELLFSGMVKKLETYRKLMIINQFLSWSQESLAKLMELLQVVKMERLQFGSSKAVN